MTIDITYLATFCEETGFSTLVVTSNEAGYYSCIINSQSVYTFSVFDENSIGKSDDQNFFILFVIEISYTLVRIDSFADPLQQVNFSMDSSVSMLYYPSSIITHPSISDSDIHWTNDIVQDGEEKVYSLEYPNPADLTTLFSDVGAGIQTFSCFYRMSLVTLLGSLQLALKGKFIEMEDMHYYVRK